MANEKKSVPGWQAEGYRHIWMPYCQMHTSAYPVPVVATRDFHLVLEDGRLLIDGLASWWSACHGYNHPHIREAVESQLAVMPHVMLGGINHPQALKLATRLAALTPGDLDRVFFCDSGSVAVEIGMKMAVQFWLNRGISGKHQFVSFRHAYHGDTMAAMSVCDPVNSMHSHFSGYLPQQHCVPIPRGHTELDRFRTFIAEHKASLAAVIIEPIVQGAGGMRFHDADILSGVRDACSQNDVLLIADEIATGFGRTGRMFACEHADVTPDIMCVSKALTGGTMALAATIARNHVFAEFLSDDFSHAMMHGPTFMANPLACAAGNASLDLFEQEPRITQAADMEPKLRDWLERSRSLTGVVDVRAKGAVGVIQVNKLRHIDRLRSAFVDCGVWIRPFGDAIYITPSLNMPDAELKTLCDSMCDVVRGWSNW